MRLLLSFAIVLSMLGACASQRPLPERTVPTAMHLYRERAPNLGSVLLDTVDGPALVKPDAPTPPWPSLCATPCALTLARGDHKLTLWFTDEIGRVSVDHLTVQVGEQPTVHRRALTRYKVFHRGLQNTATVVGLIGLGFFSAGLASLPWGEERDDFVTSGIFMGSGAVLVAVAAVCSAFAGKRLRGSELVFPWPQAR